MEKPSTRSWVLVKRGYWRIGDGANTHIWGNGWLPNQVGHQICSPKVASDHEMMVSKLMVPGESIWNCEPISNLFFPFEVQQIINIPSISGATGDKFIWGEEGTENTR